MANIKLVIVVAVSENGVIGRAGDMPWKLSTDLKRFKALTLGKPMIMGRKTFESIGSRPLPGRPHVIITRSTDYHPPGVTVVNSLVEAIDQATVFATQAGVDEIVIAGGGEIYRQALPLADELYVTHVEARIEGDTQFPDIDLRLFDKVEEQFVPAGEKDSEATRYVVYHRSLAE